MANPMRGEVDVVIDGQTRTLRLTLGALAELEEALGAESLVDLAGRLEGGRMRARDVIAVLAAGLRGAGEPAADLAQAAVQGGASGAARAAAALLVRAFGAEDA
jgi:hypothetical protein